MPGTLSRRRFVLALVGSLELATLGCGTILHPERRGQPAGRLDWKIVALNGIGLLFFFIPGVIAFAVDFNNGTIYLPQDPYYSGGGRATQRTFVTIPIQGQVTPAAIEAALAEHTSRSITLEPGQYETEELDALDQFWERHDARLAG